MGTDDLIFEKNLQPIKILNQICNPKSNFKCDSKPRSQKFKISEFQTFLQDENSNSEVQNKSRKINYVNYYIH